MPGKNAKQWILGSASAAILMSFSFPTHADGNYKPRKTNINLAVASNFYGVPPSNSAITDIINAFMADNPNYTVTVVDNGATATLESNIINGNTARVDLFGDFHLDKAAIPWQNRPVILELLQCRQQNSTTPPFRMTI